MGEISKQVFKHFAEFECDRQLFIDLGEADPRWLEPMRSIVEPPFAMGSARSGLAELGRAYERSVYDLLTRNPNARFRSSLSADTPVVQSPFDAALLVSLHAELAAAPVGSERYLLEHAWTTPDRFIEFAFATTADEALPISKSPGVLRPDILVVGNQVDASATGPVWEVLPDATLRVVPEAERASRFGINVIDIKHAHEQGVGRGHLIELLYYALALSNELDRLAMRDRFFVRADGNGIFPKRDLTALATLLVGAPRELIVPLAWRDTVHLFESVRRRVRELRESAPRAIDRALDLRPTHRGRGQGDAPERPRLDDGAAGDDLLGREVSGLGPHVHHRVRGALEPGPVERRGSVHLRHQPVQRAHVAREAEDAAALLRELLGLHSARSGRVRVRGARAAVCVWVLQRGGGAQRAERAR